MCVCVLTCDFFLLFFPLFFFFFFFLKVDEWNVPLTRRERGVDEKESQRGLGGGGRLSVVGSVASGAAELQPGFGSGSGHRFDASAVRCFYKFIISLFTINYY